MKEPKYYAIKVGNGVKNVIVRSWDECFELVRNYPSVYKSFKTEEEALDYLDTVDVEKVQAQSRKAQELASQNKIISARLDRNLVELFQNKCSELQLTIPTVLQALINEWICEQN